MINLDTYKIPGIFNLIKEKGEITDEEMLRTFNLGIGLTVVTDLNHVETIINHIRSSGFESFIIGKIMSGNGNVVTQGKLKFD